MKKYIGIVLVSLLFVVIFVPTTYANQWVAGNVRSISDYGSYGNEGYQILITLTNQTWHNGDTSDGEANCIGNFRLMNGKEGVTEEIKNRIFTLMLSAYLAGKKVNLYVNTTTGPGCIVQIGKIDTFWP